MCDATDDPGYIGEKYKEASVRPERVGGKKVKIRKAKAGKRARKDT